MILLPRRVPGCARAMLGIAESGAALPGPSGAPLGRALRGLGVRREPLEARLTPGLHDTTGEEQVIYSAARLWLGAPIAVVTERVYRSFLAAFPRPWAPSPR